MRLKHLALQGYKSFATRTEFEFSDGITAIVGPNGSGKSNVADAIRWAMGEQSMLALRGRSTADMIFSGGESRSRAGMAEVALTFDNSDGWLPVDFVEVVLTRRAYRSGENEYLLNGSRVRRRDLSDMLADSGLGRSQYVVVGQGLVDAALALRPRERRALFEEAAGISLYRSRREVTLGRLSETDRNLERVGDIMAEIAPRLRRLERAARRERERQEIVQQLTAMQRTLYGYQWGRRQAMLGPARRKSEELANALAAREAELAVTARELAAARSRRDDVQAEVRDLRRLYAGFRERSASVTRNLAVAQERARLTGAQRQEASRELARLEVQEAELAASVGELTADLSRLEREHAERQEALDELRGQSEQYGREANEAAGRSERAARDVRARRTRVATLDDQIQAMLREVAQDAQERAAEAEEAQRLRARGELALAELSRVSEVSGLQETKVAEAKSSFVAEERELRTKAGSLRALELQWEAWTSQAQQQPQLAEVEGDLNRLRQQLSEVGHDLLKVRRLVSRLEGEASALRQMGLEGNAQQAGIAASTEALGPNALGTVASLISVPAEWERAVEVGLGEDLNAVVVKFASDVEAAAQAVLAAHGSVVLLPLEAVSDPPTLPEAATCAADVATFSAAVAPAARALLGRVALCENMAEALGLQPDLPPGGVCVARDGSSLRADGAVSVGQIDIDGTLAVQRGLLDLEARMESSLQEAARLEELEQGLAERVGRMETRAADARRSAESDRQSTIQALREQLSEARAEVALAEQAMSSRRETVERETTLAEQYRQRAAALQVQADEAVRAEQELRAPGGEQRFEASRSAGGLGIGDTPTPGPSDADAARDAQLARLMSTRDAESLAAGKAQEALDAAAAEAAAAQRRSDEFERGPVSDARTRLAVAIETVRSLRSAVQRERAASERLRSRRGELAERLAHMEGTREPLAEQMQVLRASAAELEARVAELEERIREAESEISEIDATLRTLEETERRVEAQVREVEVRHQQSLLHVARTEDRLRSLSQRIEQDLGLVDVGPTEAVTAQSPLPLRPLVSELPVVEELPPGLEDQIRKLRDRERRYRGTNPNALAEYEETNERYTYLADQSDDLRSASTELRRAVSELDQLMASAFWETFEKVAQEFSATFPVLFGGGSAHLELTEPDDLLGSGVDVLARPPGKRGQRLAMLSGGERALTATALLFSLLKISPTPFSVLDEVDATLDEANAGRFRVLLDDRARQTQFVVITHNRVTIEAADTIYGVSMGGDGVSQVVSMKL